MTVRFTPKPGAVLAIAPEALDVSYAPWDSRMEVTVDEGVAVVTVVGPLDHHAGGPFDNYDAILARIESAMACDDARAVVLCFDSPGGDASGMIEAHRKIKRLRKEHGKPCYAYVNETMASAAYGLGSACDEIWGPSTGIIGSVGVISVLEDRTEADRKAGIRIELVTSGERKADRRPDRELTPEILERVQEQVMHFANAFWKVVSKSRGISVSDVVKLQAGVFYGKDAVKVGLSDGVAGWDDFLLLVKETHGGGASAKDAVSSKDKQGAPPQRTQEMRLMSALLKKTQERKALLAKLAAATTDDDRVKLAAALTKLEASDVSSKMIKHEKVTEKYQEEGEEEDEDEEDEESAEEEDGSEESEESAEDDDEDDDDKDDEDDEDDDEDEEESAKALLAHNGRKAKALLAKAKKLTGAKSVGELFGALDALGVKLAASAKTADRVAKLEKTAKRDKVLGMLKTARREGRVTPAQMASLTEQGMKSPKWLKGYLATLDKRVRTSDDEIKPALNASGAPDFESQIAAVSSKSAGLTDAEKILKAASSGMSADERKAFGAKFSEAEARANAKFNVGPKGPRY